ncbi:hypothetical protein [Fimbriiglobus ruber]|uniref:Uncharacterized protein n=1 Tax=Fimbriiglobus ruber TaxID=1908690 RepID=A0A225DPH5_9BACT|nr:hypothetical protein [Fimbriiglobus ruber]OWK41584.1 hypothetical protein FRUB_03662 [Fimbriiglobus ruber]
MPDTLPFVAARASTVGTSREWPDVAAAALQLLARLRDAVHTAVKFRDTARALEDRSPARRWGVPPLFFFDPRAQAEWSDARPGAEPFTADAARRDPAGAAAWAAVRELSDDALSILSASAEARHAARATPGLVAAVRSLAPDLSRARRLADVLAIPDDEVFRVIHPAAGFGVRVTTRGVADVYQFHALLAAEVTGDPGRGLLPGSRPDPRVRELYRDQTADPIDPVAATAEFQLFRSSALRPDGTLPDGFAGSDHWLWGPEPLAVVARERGERVVLLGEPAFRKTWDAVRRLPLVAGDLSVIEFLSADEVAAWIAARAGKRQPERSARPIRLAA